jgi:mRNA interferase MazF
MVKKRYVPDRGDVVWLTFDPQAGHEQAGRRPALVISPFAYYKTVGLGLFCPLTKQPKGYVWEVAVPAGHNVSGAVLSDQVKSFDWKARKAEFICRLPETVVEDVLQKLSPLLEPEEG